MHSSNANHQQLNMSQQQHASSGRQSPMTAVDRQTEEIATFLLSLKHSRSVSPEPSESGYQSASQTPLYEQLNDYGYPVTPDYNETVSTTSSSFSLPTLSTSAACSEYNWTQLLDNSSLVKPEDRDLVPDALFVAMAQMKVCHLTQEDRVGCYKGRELGFLGMCCKHCGGQPGFGRYYPNSVRSLAQTTTSQTILKHIGSKCRYAPAPVRTAVMELQREQVEQEGIASGRPRYGSRKVFFQRVWSRLHGKGASIDDDLVSKVSAGSGAHSDIDDQTTMSGHSDAEHYHDEPVFKRKNGFLDLPLQKNKRIKVHGPTYEV